MKRQAREVYGFVPARPSVAPRIARFVLAAVLLVIAGVFAWPA